jgi:hypothetical protein
MMNFEVKWTKATATRFYGQLVLPGQAIFVPANLAVQKHDANDGWVCLEIDKARAALVPQKEVTITDPVKIDDKKVAEKTVEKTDEKSETEKANATGGTTAANTLPPTGAGDSQLVGQQSTITSSSPELNDNANTEAAQAGTQNLAECEICHEKFSKRKLVAHKKAAHPEEPKVPNVEESKLL